MYDVDKSFETARDLFNALLEKSVFEADNIFDVSEKTTNSFIFRGQAQKEWSLLPSAHRDANVLDNYTPQPPPEDESLTKEEYITFHAHAELRAVFLFLEAADHIGIKTPLDYNLFKGSVDASDAIFKSALLPSFALAQHHGVPTRLLDWTESPFVAAYFAAKSALSNPPDSHLSIICLNSYMLKSIECIDLVSAPKADNKFLKAQRGLFTFINCGNQYYKKHEKWPSLEDILEEKRTSAIYPRYGTIRLSLPVSEAGELLKLLYKLDISNLTIAPSLSNAAQHFKYKKELWN